MTSISINASVLNKNSYLAPQVDNNQEKISIRQDDSITQSAVTVDTPPKGSDFSTAVNIQKILNSIRSSNSDINKSLSDNVKLVINNVDVKEKREGEHSLLSSMSNKSDPTSTLKALKLVREQLERHRATSQLDIHTLSQQMNIKKAEISMPKLLTVPTLPSAQQSNLMGMIAMSSMPAFADNASNQRMISDSEFCELASSVINNIQTSYVEIFQNAVTKYTDFYQDFSNMVTAKLFSHIKPAGKDNYMDISADDIRKDLVAFIDKYFIPAKPLNPSAGGTTANNWWTTGNNRDKGTPPKGGAILYNGGPGKEGREKAEQWIDKFGQGVLVESGNPLIYHVSIDPRPLKDLLKALDDLGRNDSQYNVIIIDNTKYQAWKAGFDIHDDNYKNQIQRIAQKYSQENSAVDNLFKILGNMISQLYGVTKESWANIR